MAEQETDAVRGLLARLEEAREAATPGPWDTYSGIRIGAGAERFEYVGEVAGEEDAALIVAAVNALPALTAVVRAVLDLADEHAGCCQYVAVDRLRAAVAEALRGEAGR